MGYAYSIDKYEVTNSEYAAFLTSVAATDPYNAFDISMGGAYGGLTRSGDLGSYSYSARPGYEDLPVNFVSWGSAARFANWLTNGQPIGAEGPTTTEDGSYDLNGAVTDAEFNGITREPGATVVIPSEDEWYKAAYFNPATSTYFKYPTSNDTAPSNSLVDTGNNANYGTPTANTDLTPAGYFSLSASPYGTFDQGGNVWEWTESTAAFGVTYDHVLRGGSIVYPSDSLLSSYRLSHPFDSNIDFIAGFRVAMVPEPSTAVLAVIGLPLLALWGQGDCAMMGNLA